MHPSAHASHRAGKLQHCVEALESRLMLAGLIRGGGFESAADVAQWYTFNGTSVSSVSTAPAPPENDNVAFVDAPVASFGVIGQNLNSLVANGSFVRDSDYRISAWVRMASAGQSDDITLTIRYQDSQADAFPTVDRAEVSDTAWVKLEGGFRLGYEGALNDFHVQVYGPNSGADFYVDDVQIEAHDWRAVTDQRIEQVRKRDASLTFVDPSGASVEVASVQMQQIAHEFGFGTAVHTGNLTNANYTQFVTDHFDWVTPENAWKWAFTERQQGVEEYADIVMPPQTLSADGLATFAEENGLQVRGHNVLWSSTFGTPEWVFDIDTSTAPGRQQLLEAIHTRIESVVSRYSSDASHWDVVNELLVDDFLRENLDALSNSGSIIVDVFAQVAQLDPDATLFTNEFNIVNRLEQGTVYRDLLDQLVDTGASVGGIGIQSHFTDYVPISSFDIESEIRRFSYLNLPIWISEFSNKRTDIDERAKDLEIFLRTVFSLPEVDGATFWGFWEGAAGTGTPFERGGLNAGPDGALVASDWTVNAAGQMLQSLLDEWTITTGTETATSQFNFRGYHGQYEVTATLADGQTVTQTIGLSSDGSGTALITVPVPAVQFETTQVVSLERPLTVVTAPNEFEVIPIFGSSLEFQGQVTIDVELSTSNIGGIILRDDATSNEVSVYRWDGTWIVEMGVDGDFWELTTLPTTELSGTLQLVVSHDARQIEVTGFGGSPQTLPLTMELFAYGDDLRMYTFSGPSSFLNLNHLTIAHATTAGFPHAFVSLRDAAATQGIVFGALPDTWIGAPDVNNLFTHHSGLLTLPLDYPTDVGDPAASFQDRDSLLSYAVANDMAIRGHSLVWHENAPAEYAAFTRSELIEAMRDQIQNTILAYPEVREWVVVNEPLNHDGSLRDSVYRHVIGDEYIDLAFQFARAVAAPDVVLIINEYGAEIPGNAKSDAYFHLVADLLAGGTAIDAVGVQGHLGLADAPIPSYAQTFDNLTRLAGLGIAVHVTELDVSTVHFVGSAAEKEAAQAAIYSEFISACVDSGVCASITTWAYIDTYSWLNSPSVNPAMNDMPLLFDGNLDPKASYFAIASALSGTRAFVDNLGTLVVEGTANRDRILITPRRASEPAGSVRVIRNGKSLGIYQPFNQMVVRGFNGNDLIRVSKSARIGHRTELHGGEGNDRLFAGREDSTLDGGNGNDLLRGAHGDDTLIGGDGQDRLFGSWGNDYLDGGTVGETHDGYADRLIGNSGTDTFVWRLLDRIIGRRAEDEVLGES